MEIGIYIYIYIYIYEIKEKETDENCYCKGSKLGIADREYIKKKHLQLVFKREIENKFMQYKLKHLEHEKLYMALLFPKQYTN